MSDNKYQTYKFFCTHCEEYFDVTVYSMIHNIKVYHSCGKEAKCVFRQKIEDNIPISLTNKDLDLIFKWYDKGFTNIDEDKPLLDKLKEHYQAS